jgi:hypothetical protein
MAFVNSELAVSTDKQYGDNHPIFQMVAMWRNTFATRRVSLDDQVIDLV